MLSCSDVKLVFCFALINSVAAITPKTINDARAEFSQSSPFFSTNDARPLFDPFLPQ